MRYWQLCMLAFKKLKRLKDMQQYQTATTTTKDAQQPSTSSAAALDAAAVSSAFSSLISSASGLQPLQPVATGAPATQATTTGQPQAKRKQVKNACSESKHNTMWLVYLLLKRNHYPRFPFANFNSKQTFVFQPALFLISQLSKGLQKVWWRETLS